MEGVEPSRLTTVSPMTGARTSSVSIGRSPGIAVVVGESRSRRETFPSRAAAAVYAPVSEEAITLGSSNCRTKSPTKSSYSGAE